MPDNATIVIPDISGYTEFLTTTELDHSSRIINELLEVLVASNSLELTLSEVEGDALLFYRKGKPIELAAVILQCLAMFEHFHNQLTIIDRVSICRCGACRNTSNLTLKFIAHYGVIKEFSVSGFTKAAGVDMVIAHRLLKNSIDSHEYILLTQNYLNNLSDNQFPPGLAWQHSSEEYPAVGSIEYKYALLEKVKKSVAPVSGRLEQAIELDRDTLEVEIEAPLRDVYGKLIDIDHRSDWFIGSQITERGEEVTERIGLKYKCLFQGMTLEITVMDSQIGKSESEIIYVEEVKVIESDARFRHTYVLRSLDARKTLLSFDLRQIAGPELPQEGRSRLLMVFKRNLEVLKEHCEK